MIQEFTQIMKEHIHDVLRELHTAIPGKIITFDSAKCEATVQPFGKFKKPDGSNLGYPQINEVPVYVMQGSKQTATFVYPIKPGDECILFFAEQALDAWQTKAESDTDLCFDLTNAVAIVGLFAKPNPLVKEACADNSIIIEKDGERVRLKKGETYIQDTAGQYIEFTPTRITVQANNEVVNVKENAKHTSANTDIESQAPVGIKGTGTLLGEDVLRPYWKNEAAAWNLHLPVPPVPPLIVMALNNIRAELMAADSAAQSSSSLSIK